MRIGTRNETPAILIPAPEIVRLELESGPWIFDCAIVNMDLLINYCENAWLHGTVM